MDEEDDPDDKKAAMTMSTRTHKSSKYKGPRSPVIDRDYPVKGLARQTRCIRSLVNQTTPDPTAASTGVYVLHHQHVLVM